METRTVASSWNQGNRVESKIPLHAQGYSGSVKPYSVAYEPVAEAETHTKIVGYLLWLIGFTGAHRFYYGKPLTGILWFFTCGLCGVGWIVDAFLIPSMNDEANRNFRFGPIDYSLTWLLLIFTGIWGFHRFAQGRYVTGLIFALTLGCYGIGYVYDLLTMNRQVDALNRNYHLQS